MVQLPSQAISVRGDTTAKLCNEQPAYSRVSVMREVEFACQRCGQDVRELRYPGPLPKYCPACCAIVAQIRNEERVIRQRERRKTAAAQRKVRRVPSQEGVSEVEHEQINSLRRAEEQDQEPSFRHLLPETIRLLNRIGRIGGEELASAVAAVIATELERQRLMLTEARTGLVIAFMEQGSQIGHAGLPDVDLAAGLDAYCAFCTHASLEDLQAARDNAQRIVEAPDRRRRLTQLASEQRERS